MDDNHVRNPILTFPIKNALLLIEKIMNYNDFFINQRILTHVRKIDAQGRLNLPETLLSTVGINRSEGLKAGIADNNVLLAMNPSSIVSFMEKIEKSSEPIDEKLKDQILFQYENLLCSEALELDEKNRITVPIFIRRLLGWKPNTELDLHGSPRKKQLLVTKLEFNPNSKERL